MSATDGEPAWQHISENSWEYGIVARGMIRKPLARLEFSTASSANAGPWVWYICERDGSRGREWNRQEAAQRAEECSAPARSVDERGHLR